MALFASRTGGAFDNGQIDFASLAALFFPGSLALNDHFNSSLHGIFGDDKLDITTAGASRPDITFLGRGFTKDATSMTGGGHPDRACRRRR